MHLIYKQKTHAKFILTRKVSLMEDDLSNKVYLFRDIINIRARLTSKSITGRSCTFLHSQNIRTSWAEQQHSIDDRSTCLKAYFTWFSLPVSSSCMGNEIYLLATSADHFLTILFSLFFHVFFFPMFLICYLLACF